VPSILSRDLLAKNIHVGFVFVAQQISFRVNKLVTLLVAVCK